MRLLEPIYVTAQPTAGPDPLISLAFLFEPWGPRSIHAVHVVPYFRVFFPTNQAGDEKCPHISKQCTTWELVRGPYSHRGVQVVVSVMHVVKFSTGRRAVVKPCCMLAVLRGETGHPHSLRSTFCEPQYFLVWRFLVNHECGVW